MIIGVAVWFALCAPRTRRLRLGLFAAVPAAVMAGLVTVSHYLVLGSPFTTPCASHLRANGTSDQSFSHYSLSQVFVHFFETFISARNGHQRVATVPLFEWSPFLVLLPLGMWLILQQKQALLSIYPVVDALSLGLSILYLSFVAGGGKDLLYRNDGYSVPFYPYWTVLCVFAVNEAIKFWRTRVKTVN